MPGGDPAPGDTYQDPALVDAEVETATDDGRDPDNADDRGDRDDNAVPADIPPQDPALDSDETGADIPDNAATDEKCVPDCSGKVCGPDNCGTGVCGFCQYGWICNENGTACAPDCKPDCAGKSCGDDGCGGDCGACDGGKVCQSGSCICKPEDHKECCGDAVCWLDSCGVVGAVVAQCPFGCKDAVCQACIPACKDRECGADGCGGDCGTCAGGGCNGMAWTAPETCFEGSCITSQGGNCNDGNDCTTDKCDPAVGCSHENLGDGSICVHGSCDGAYWTRPNICIAGRCEGGRGVEQCDDGNECTDEACEPDKGCSWTANSSACNDGNPCTTGDTCLNEDCIGTGTLDCNDNNPCTADSCVNWTGCKHVPTNEGKTCASGVCVGLDWTAPSLCIAGSCTQQGGLSCDDEVPCTTDSCAPATGCANTVQANKCLIDGACYSGNAANLADACQACLPGLSQFAWTPRSCDDGKVCTKDSCDSSGGCHNDMTSGYCIIDDQCYGDGQISAASNCTMCSTEDDTTGWTVVADGTDCAAGSCSGINWTEKKTCVAGQCSGGGSTRSCDDGIGCTLDSCNATAGGCQNPLFQSYCYIDGKCYLDQQLKGSGAPENCFMCSVKDSTSSWGFYPGKCVIDGICYDNGKVNPANKCQACTFAKSPTSWSAAAEGVQCAAASCADLTLSLPKKCAAGGCVGALQNCDDGLSCTSDSCSTNTGCANVLIAGSCLIGGNCYADGETSPDNPCQVCKPATSTSAWQLMPSTCLIGGTCYEEGDHLTNPCLVCAAAKSTSVWSNAPVGTECVPGICSFQDYTTPKTCNATGGCEEGGTTTACTNTQCSIATCTDAAGCSQAVAAGFCLINGLCYDDRAINPSQPCEECLRDSNPMAWTVRADLTTCGTNQVCLGGSCCTRQCTGKTCGDDQCGGTCGTCSPHFACQSGKCVCVPQCTGTPCGSDGCGETCGTCESGETCKSGKCWTALGFNDNLDGTITDPGTGLMWEQWPGLGTYSAAVGRCADLNKAGHSNWSLPTISELRSLSKGCPDTAPNGPCPADDGCKPDIYTCYDWDTCSGCNVGDGPGPGGTYHDGVFALAAAQHWSSTRSSVGATTVVFGFSPSDASVYYTPLNGTSTARVRCVRHL